MTKEVCLVGLASDLGGAQQGSGDGPFFVQKSPYLLALNRLGLLLSWRAMLKPAEEKANSPFAVKLKIIAEQSYQLALEIQRLVQDKQFFTVIGGDHSSAIGTWSGAYHAIKQQGSLGLIWIDAHMDSHTPRTSETGNIHGMPLACLLGHGDTILTSILDIEPKLQPQHLCLIGARSYEQGEEALLQKLNVRIFYMDEVKRRGLDAVMQDAIRIVKNGTAGFGVSIDVDSLDPEDAPGTGVAEPGGIRAAELYSALRYLRDDSALVGIEIAEFDPHRDQEAKTEKVVANIIASVKIGKLIE